MDEARLLERLRKIEALHEGATTPGEERAAAAARERVRVRLLDLAGAGHAVEHRFSLPDPWTRRLFLALLRRYGLKPYRYPRQRRTTVMVRVATPFVEETLWPSFLELSETLREYLSEITERVIAASVHPDASEAAEVVERAHLVGGARAAP